MPIEIPKLDDRSFEQLFAEAKVRIPVHTPEWTNFNDSDPGITVVQLFAFMTENLLYRSNRIPEANRRKFLTLLNVGLQPATPGRGLVVFRNERGPVQPWPLDAGVELRAGKVPFRTRTGVCILPVTASVFYKKPQPDLDEATAEQIRLVFDTLRELPTDQLQPYQSTPLEAPQIGKPLPEVDLTNTQTDTIDRALWVALVGPKNVPVETVRAAIANQTLALGLYPSPDCDEGKRLPPATTETEQRGDSGLLFEIAAPEPDPTGRFGIGEPRYRRLTPEYAENVLERPGIVQLPLPAYESLLLWDDLPPQEEGTSDYPPLVEDKDLAKRIATWIRIRLPKEEDTGTGSGEAAPQKARISWVGVNAARVIQALPVTNERLGVGTGAPNQRYKVANTPIFLDEDDEELYADEAGNFTLQVRDANGNWETWERTDDLFAAGPDDARYTVDPESGIVQFGSGLRGMRPPLGRDIRVSYEYGGGPEGEVAIGAINKSAALPGGFKVENPVPTWGADAGETVAEGEQNISRYLKHRDRAVTESDFRDIVRRTPGVEIGRVEVLPLFSPNLFDQTGQLSTSPGTVTVMVIPKNDPEHPNAPEPDRLFLDAVCEYLDPRRLLTTEIYVRGPEYVSVLVSVGIVTMPGQLRERVRRDVQAALQDYLSPLIGGPPVVGAPDTDPCADTTESDACPEPRGLGWPLSMEVRQQDLEAVATRVPGVRYVEGILLGTEAADGTLQTNAGRVSIAGLQLPRLDVLAVREGSPESLEALLGQQPTDTQTRNQVPVPLLPATC